MQTSAAAPLARRPFGPWRASVLGTWALSVVLSGCGIAPNQPQRHSAVAVHGTIVGAPDLNPDARNRPSPLMVRIYALRSDAAVRQADFVSIATAEQAVLGNDLAMKVEFVVAPGQSQTFERTVGADVRWVAAIGLYRQTEKAEWRAVMPVPAGASFRFTVRADSRAVSLTASP